MQIKSLESNHIGWRIDDNTSAEALGRLKQLEWVERLRGEGCSEATSLAVVGWSRATYYRWLRRYREAGLKGLESGTRAPRGRRVCQWTKQQAQQVLHLRKRYPLWGKRKLWRVLVRERGWTLSESTVGRIVARLVRLGRVEPVSFYYGQVKPKRRRQFTHHAKRWRYGMKAKAPGELMQADHMSVSFTEGACVKEFKATCPVSKWSGLQVYSRATSRNAKRFLAYLQAQAPFPIRSLHWTAARNSGMSLSRPARKQASPCMCCPRKSPSTTAVWSAPTAPVAMSSTRSTRVP